MKHARLFAAEGARVVVADVLDAGGQTRLAGLGGREATLHCRCVACLRRIPRPQTRMAGRHNARPHTTDADRTTRSNSEGGGGSTNELPEDAGVAGRTVTLPIVAGAISKSAIGVGVTIGGEADTKARDQVLIGDDMMSGAA